MPPIPIEAIRHFAAPQIEDKAWNLQYVQRAIDEGYILRGRDPRFLEFVFIESVGRYQHVLLVLKTGRFGLEVWVQTFRQTDEGRLRSKLRKQALARPHS